MSVTVSIDTGSTFTDGYFTRDGAGASAKVFTTPHDVTVGMIDCVAAGAAEFDVPVSRFLAETTAFRFSSTIVTNAILQRTGRTTVGLVTSPVDREAREQLIDSGFLRADLIREISDPFDDREVAAGVEALLDAGAQALAVSLDGSWLDPGAERAVRAVARRLYPTHYLGAVRCFLAGDVSAAPGTGVRTNTVVVAAYVHDLLGRATYQAENRLRRDGLRTPVLLVQGHGGVARTAKTLALHTYSSGPVAGALGAGAAPGTDTTRTGLAMDVGGTSTDLAVIDRDRLAKRWTATLGGLPVHVPLVPVDSVAVGGGTLADGAGGELGLGPLSAGVTPGPACFGRGGTRATVTDANVALGLLAADDFHGGRFTLRADLATAALDRLGAELGCDGITAARMIRARAADLMAAGIRGVLSRMAGVVLVAYGGGGGLHAADVAERLGIERIAVPWSAAVFNAVGVSAMDIGHVYPLLLTDTTDGQAARRLLADARRDVVAEGFDWSEAAVGLEVGDADQDGTTLWRRSWTGPPPESEMHAAWTEAVEAGAGARTPIAVLSTTIAAGARAEAVPTGGDAATHESVGVDWGNGPEPTTRTVLGRHPPAGLSVEGPAVVTLRDTTVAVPAAWTLSQDGPWLTLRRSR